MAPKGRGRGRGNGQQNQAGGGGRPPGGGGPPQPPPGQGRAAQPPPGEPDQRMGGTIQHAPERRAPPPAAEQKTPVPPKQQSKTFDLKEIGLELKQMEPLAPHLPRRPGVGTAGRKIKLITNNFPVKLPRGNIYHYDVEITNKNKTLTSEDPKLAQLAKSEKEDKKENKKYRCMGTRLCREVITHMLETNEKFSRVLAAYDGRKNLYTKNPLPNAPLTCNVSIQEDGGNPNDPRGPRITEYNVTVKPVNRRDTGNNAINLDSLHALFNNQVTEVNNDAFMALETVLRHSPCMKFSPVGRSFFYKPDERDLHPLGGGKEIWFGYHQSLRLGQWKPLVNLDMTATTFWQSKSLIDYAVDLLGFRDITELKNLRVMRDSDIKLLSKKMRNFRIETTHLKTYKRKYRIVDFTREPANRLTFNYTDKSGKESRVTIEQYFKMQYNRQLEFPQLCCVQGSPKEKNIYLPMEVCRVVEGQHCKQKLEPKQTAEMIKFTARAPKLRFREIENISRMADFNRDKFLKEFGIEVSNQPMQLEGRVIEAPNVRYTGRNDKIKIKPREGQWDMRDLNYFQGSKINKWVLLSFSDPRFLNEDSMNRFAQLLVKIATEQGIAINRPEHIGMANKRNGILPPLQDVMKKFSPNLILVVVPGRDKEIYGQIKKAAELNIGVVTQCVKDENVKFKCNPALISNLCQKINAKTGGINTSLILNECPLILRKPVIIIGADVNHPAPGSDMGSKPSIAACVGSLDAHPMRYAVTVRAQCAENKDKKSQEIILDLADMVVELLKAFHRATKGVKPEKIVFYRDGVSEGQFEQVRDQEVRAIRKACSYLSPEYKPGITMIIVQKRHHTRFMPQDDRDGAGKMRNVPPGTAVDNSVTHPLNFDFFLCSHLGLQGTSRPCHYTVIWDDNDFSADDLQKLSYYLCHTYARCTKSVSAPVPVMYAHLAAFRAKEHYTAQFGDSSSDSASTISTVSQLSDAVVKSVRVLDFLKDTMYFV